MKTKLIKWLDKNRKTAAAIAALFSVCLALPFILNDNMDARVIASVALCLMLLLLGALFFLGVPLAAMLLTFAALISAGVAASIMFNLHFSGVANEQIDSGITCVIVILTVIFPLPTKVRNKVSDILQPEKKDKENTIGKITQVQATYQLYRQQGRAHRYQSKPYSTINQSPIMKIVRLIFGLAVFFIGLVGVIFYVEETIDGLYHSNLFLGLTLSISLLVLGFALILYGLKRALISAAAFAALMAGGYWVGLRLSDLLRGSIPGFVVLLTIILMFVARAFYDIYRFYRKRTAHQNFSAYEKQDNLVVADLSLFNMLPVKDYYKIGRCRLTVDPQKGSHTEIVALITIWSNQKRLIFCGYVAEPPNLAGLPLTLYIYTKKDFAAYSDFFKKGLVKAHCKDISWESLDDPDWSVYREALYPDTYSLNTIKNGNLSSYLENNGHDFNNPVSLIYTLTFEEEENAISCANAATEEGYLRARYFSNAEAVSENDLPKKYSNIVYVQNECRAGVEQLNAQTLKIMGFAEKYNGELDDFDLGELNEVTAEPVAEA